MPFPIYLGWGLLVPAGLSLLYGFTAHRAMIALGYEQRDSNWNRLGIALPTMLLFTIWGVVNIPLPAVYILAFFIKLSRLLQTKNSRAKKMFLINLTHLATMALHMILIGAVSLAAKSPMYELLEYPLWRIVTIGTVLVVNNLVAWLLPRWDTFLGVLRTQSDSAEVRPFMVFLWFCNVFLLLDSVLCNAHIDWNLLPIFLIGSTLLLEFYLTRFLRHLYSILKVNYLEEEHRRLTAELERQNQNAARLRSKSVLDSMTGIFSRRYAVKQIEFFLQEKEAFSLVFIDLDHLKQVNDRDGHHAGDLFIIRFVKEFGAYLRRADIFARFGGDEFIVLLPGCMEESTRKRIEDIRDRMAGGFSYGVAFVPGNTDDNAEQIIRRADQSMYQDKQKRLI